MKSFQFTIDGRKYETTVNEIEDNIAEVTVNGTVFHVAIDKKKTTSSIKPAAPKAAAAPAAPRAAQPAGSVVVKSPLPGSIVKVVAAAGQPVKKGDLLLTMESMKMENQVTSEYDGTIKSVLVQPGQNVMQDDKLVEIETVAVAAAPVAPKVAPAPQPAPAAPAAPKAAEAPAGGKKVVSPLPGSIIKVAVTEGQAVKRGDLLLTLESMKMENQVLAEFDGTVTKIAVTAGQNVMQDDLLVVLG